MTLSVVIVTYNSAEVLPACLATVRSRLPEAEVIVVDNASTDGTRALCEPRDDVTLIANGRNDGFGRACNAGVQAARSTHVLLLNPDVELSAVEAVGLEHELARRPFGLCAPQVQDVGAGGSTARHWARELVGHVLGPLRPQELPSLARTRRPGQRWWPFGALLLIERDEFLRLGGFDRRFFLYYEDRDLSRRYREAGLPVRSTASIVGRHVRGRSTPATPTGTVLRNGWSYISWIQYLAIWYGPATALRAARSAEWLRGRVLGGLAMLERWAPVADRAARKREQLAEVTRFIRTQTDSTPGDGFCPAAREILAGL